MGNYSEALEARMLSFFRSLNERDRRRYAALEAMKLGHGGIQYMSRLLGCHRETIAHGITELNSEEKLTTNRIRKKGGGRRSLTVVCPELVDNVLRILHDHTAGDPMRQEVRWTNLSRRNISRQLEKTETPASKNVVAKVLYEQGFRRRKPQKKRTMEEHKDRDAQFKNLNRLKQEYLDAGKPVLSMDTKKKETLGNFYREGVTDAIEPTIVNDHDFPSQGNGKVISR
ncbi:ISAzo13 family transposase [Endozoicomonas sp.]|uniref:ISAzo13 family transposase n=1 Tax=Endozoicomonas sp. TaxID=1892382 RepID=UPI00383BBD9D